jgi:hypothetical protein
MEFKVSCSLIFIYEAGEHSNLISFVKIFGTETLTVIDSASHISRRNTISPPNS